MNYVTYPRKSLPICSADYQKNQGRRRVLAKLFYFMSLTFAACFLTSTTEAQNAIPVNLTVDKIRSSDVAVKPRKNKAKVSVEIKRFERKNRAEQIANKDSKARKVSIGVVVPIDSSGIAKPSDKPNSLDTTRQMEVIQRVTEARHELEQQLRVEPASRPSKKPDKQYDF